MIFLFAISLCSSAKQVSESDALSTAQEFLTQPSSGMMKAKSASALSLAYVAVDEKSTAKLFYVFNCGTADGFVIVSGDDRAESILGYSDSGSFDYNKIPENMRWWLSEYQRQLKFLADNPGLATTPPLKSSFTALSPLLNTTWGQAFPYNIQCPKLKFSIDPIKKYTCYTGCIATAMAQIMYHYKWPVTGTGSHGYTEKDGLGNSYTVSSTFSDHTYDWANMFETYSPSTTSEQWNAISLLMSDCGIAVDMSYNEDGMGSSGAISNSIGHALSTYFGYDKGVMKVSRDYYGYNWDNLLYNELQAGRPILYTGTSIIGSTSLSHAFIFDGADAQGRFHVNWGWDGTYNGYYHSTSLHPTNNPLATTSASDTVFRYYQDATIGIQKPLTGSASGAYYMTAESVTTKSTSAAAGTKIPIDVETFYNQGSDSVSIFSIGFLLYDVNGKVVDTASTLFNKMTHVNQGWTFTAQYKMPSLSDGTYRLYFNYQVLNESAWRLVNIKNTASQYIQFTVSGNTATIANGDKSSLNDYEQAYVELVGISGKMFPDISGAQKVNMLAENGSVIHYTTDGSTPTASSPVFSKPFAISSTTTVNVLATKFIERSSVSAEFIASPLLADLLAKGIEGKKYGIGYYLDNQAHGVIDGKNYIFATSDHVNWIRLEVSKANYDKFISTNILNAYTVIGTFSGKSVNPTLSLGDLAPSAANVSDSFTPSAYNLVDTYNPKANEVHTIIGFYYNGKLCSFSPSASGRGKIVDLNTSLIPGATFNEGVQYRFKAVVQLKAAWDAEKSPSAVKQSDGNAYVNYLVYALESPSATGVDGVEINDVNIIATQGLITVTGAHVVKIYSASGALVSTEHEAYVPAGVYLVVADGHAKKVLVR